MPASKPYSYSPHCAVLTLDFVLLQQVVQRHLFGSLRKPLVLRAASPDGRQRYEAQLKSCLVQPALHNQCALVFGFSSIQTSGPRHEGGLFDVELACLVDLVVSPAARAQGALLTFGHRLLVERGLTSTAPTHPSWFDYSAYPALNQEATRALLPALEQLVHQKLRLNLCQLNGYVRPDHDPAALWNATIGAFRVVGGLFPRLNLYYQAPEGAHSHGPSATTGLPLTGEANAGLLIGNEHLLYHLVLPALEHLYLDSLNLRPPGTPPAAGHPTFRDLFRLSGCDDAARPGALRATNAVVLQPAHASSGPERTTADLQHFVNPGDLTVELDGKIRVTVIFTLLPAGTALPELLIKLRQTYTFGLDPKLIGPSALVLEGHTLEVWGVSTCTTLPARATAFARRVLERYVVQQSIAAFFGWALSLFPRFGRRRLLQAGPGGAPAPTNAAVPPLAPVLAPVAASLPIYQVARLDPLAPTAVPEQLPPALPNWLPGTTTARLAAPEAAAAGPGAAPVSTQSFALDVQHHPAIAELNRLLVEWKTAANPLLDFYSTTWRRVLLHLLVRPNPAVAFLYDYTLGFASQFYLMGSLWQQTILQHSGIDLTTDALLARQFYGDDYLDRSLLEQQTRYGLEGLVDAALRPLLRGKNAVLLSATLRSEGLYAQLRSQPADVVPPTPTPAQNYPHPTPPSARETEKMRRLAVRSHQRLRHELAALTTDVQAFLRDAADEPADLVQQFARAQQQDLQHLAHAQRAALGYVQYAVGKVTVDGRLPKADEQTQTQVLSAILSAVSGTQTGLAQAYRALQNDALLRRHFHSRWDLPTFAAKLLQENKEAVVAAVQQLDSDATQHPTSGWGPADDPPPLASLIGQLPRWLAALQEKAECLRDAGKSLNGSMMLSCRPFQLEVEGLPGLHWEADDVQRSIIN